jgi:hypothetical protein
MPRHLAFTLAVLILFAAVIFAVASKMPSTSKVERAPQTMKRAQRKARRTDYVSDPRRVAYFI